MGKKRTDAWNTLKKLMRPWCTGSKNGGHTMIEYYGTKKCADCPYEEKIRTSRD